MQMCSSINVNTPSMALVDDEVTDEVTDDRAAAVAIWDRNGGSGVVI